MAPSTTPGGLGRIAAIVLLACLPTLARAADPGVDPWAGPWAGTLRVTHVTVDVGPDFEVDCSALSTCHDKLRSLYKRAQAASEAGAAGLRPRTLIAMMAWLGVGFEGIEYGFELEPVNGGYRPTVPDMPNYQAILAAMFVNDFGVLDERAIRTTFALGGVTATLTLTLNETGSATILDGTVSAQFPDVTGRLAFAGELSRRRFSHDEMATEAAHRFKVEKRAVKGELGLIRAKKSAGK